MLYQSLDAGVLKAVPTVLLAERVPLQVLTQVRGTLKKNSDLLSQFSRRFVLIKQAKQTQKPSLHTFKIIITRKARDKEKWRRYRERERENGERLREQGENV